MHVRVAIVLSDDLLSASESIFHIEESSVSNQD